MNQIQSPKSSSAAVWLHRVPTFLMYLGLCVFALLCLYPFVWMVSASFKTYEEVLKNPSPIPWNPTLETLVTTWNKLKFFDYFRNSVVVSALTVAGVVAIYPLAGYAFARLRFPGKEVLFVALMSMLLIPGITVLLPIVILERNLGILGTHAGLVLPYVNGAGAFSVFLMRSYFQRIPGELHEAARLDGCTEFQIYWRIYLPLAGPALTTIAVLNLLASWNSYLFPSVALTDESRYTLPLGLQNLLLTNVVRWNEVMAGALITVLPVVIVFVLLQRYYVAGLSGAVKS